MSTLMTIIDRASNGVRGDESPDLRHVSAAAVLERAEAIASDAAAVFAYSSPELLDAECSVRLGRVLVHLLAGGVHDGRVEARATLVADLHRLVAERGMSIQQVFTVVYLTERAALDELAVYEPLGALREPWPIVAQYVRRASFDLLAAYVEHIRRDPGAAALVDPLTTLYARTVFDAVLVKEVDRASRSGAELSLIVFDVDQLAAINEASGRGVGDKILERLGILVRTHFRQHDWVARHSDDSIAVLLARTDGDKASALADDVRTSVASRLGFTDHRTGVRVGVTVSAGIVNLSIGVGQVVDPDRLMADVEAAVERAKRRGRNCVERVDGYSGALSS